MQVNLAEEYPYVIYLIDTVGNYGKFYPIWEQALRLGLDHLDVSLVGMRNRRS